MGRPGKTLGIPVDQYGSGYDKICKNADETCRHSERKPTVKQQNSMRGSPFEKCEFLKNFFFLFIDVFEHPVGLRLSTRPGPTVQRINANSELAFHVQTRVTTRARVCSGGRAVRTIARGTLGSLQVDPSETYRCARDGGVVFTRCRYANDARPETPPRRCSAISRRDVYARDLRRDLPRFAQKPYGRRARRVIVLSSSPSSPADLSRRAGRPCKPSACHRPPGGRTGRDRCRLIVHAPPPAAAAVDRNYCWRDNTRTPAAACPRVRESVAAA